MIFSALKFVTKAATVVAVANTGYKVYKKGKVVYTAYKKSKQAKTSILTAITEIKKVIKKK